MPPSLTAYRRCDSLRARACAARLFTISHSSLRKQANMILMFRKALLATALVAGLFASAVFAAQVVDEVSQVPHYDQA